MNKINNTQTKNKSDLLIFISKMHSMYYRIVVLLTLLI